MLISLIYGSTATAPFSEAELTTLLAKSRKNNEALGVTGMLLYRNSNFLQVLEGEEQAVRALYAKIAKDPRHHSTVIIRTYEVEAREFGEWKMGFTNLEHLTAGQIPGYSDFLTTPASAEDLMQTPSYANIFLHTFKDLMR